MRLFKIGNKYETGDKVPGYLFISFLMDEQRIVSVWRNRKGDGEHTFKEFIESQIARTDRDSFNPDMRFYQFYYSDMRVVPLISSDNSYFVDFVSDKEPEINISFLEGLFLLQRGLTPTELLQDEPAYIDELNTFIEEQNEKEDMLRWKNEIVKTPQETDYELLGDLILKYAYKPSVTEEQIQLLNSENTALRIFHTMREYFEQTDYIFHGWDMNDFKYLIHVPTGERTPLHIIRAELFKVIDFADTKPTDSPERDKMLFELNIFLSYLDVEEGWEERPIPDLWKKIACSCMKDVASAADSISSFQYIAEITEEQINYLLRTGTTPRTLVQSGIMGNVITHTKFFKEKYGLKLEKLDHLDLSPVDSLIIDSLYLLANEVLNNAGKEGNEGTETRAVQDSIQAIEGFRKRCTDEKAEIKRRRNLNQLEQLLDKMAEKAKDPDAQAEDLLLYDGETFEDLIRANYNDTVLSEQQCRLLSSYITKIPAEIIKRTIPVFKGQDFGKLPEHQSLTIEGVIKSVKEFGLTSLHELILLIEKRQIDESISMTQKEINELNKQSLRISNQLSACEDNLERKKRQRFELKVFMGEMNVLIES